MDETNALENLMEIKEVFDRHGVNFWLDTGTLLGVVRDGRIIPWDTDIDLGTLNEKKIGSTFNELRERGFDVRFGEIKRKDVSSKILSLSRNRCSACIDLYQIQGDDAVLLTAAPPNITSAVFRLACYIMTYPEPNPFARPSLVPFAKVVNRGALCIPQTMRRKISQMMWNMGEKGFIKFARITVPKYHFESLDVVKFHGREFNIPFHVEAYLRYRYGEDWKTPNREWKPDRNDVAFGTLRPLWGS